ncbi:asparagine synthase (glutamine-hydrolyzing) [Paramagnetospirillum kuznetsovii]|uniref:asparagine synthase (glutamine-hydrolyzing) n=1 Tax=Paramagnetospirillum kuznetsovii TaxID=2053833 RepID=A0A364P412_9PROT|nr:asparagine synthase (glutamine-hydrolyzing) [Paramagnetospirillum kuznetsovii]RAU23855.1 asparagine synthase (glutamine-hydrolyzing) [Paramagnetospirillum kuznetsovii]
MCGFAGFLDLGTATPDRAAVARAMAQTLIHRGPDDDGVWTDDSAGIALGFRRLAILDLSPQGHQPMASHDGRWVVSFNGEIYNHAALKARLDPAIAWRGHSDTEILLEAVAAWGVDKAVAEFDGMFAFALWDRAERVLHLGRDRFGEKPLYWAELGGSLLFGSELKALAAHPKWDGGLDRDAMALFLRLGWIPAPHTIYAGVQKLEPATVMTVRAGERTVTRTWSAVERARAVEGSFTGTVEQATDRLEELLRASVGLRMQADVPVGLFLSGGVDSSITAALMRQLSSTPVHSFTIGFDEAGLDESPHARAVADHLGTIHTEVRISDAEALDLVPRLPHIYDEPFGDYAALPTCLLAQVTRRDVTVALSGDGADELFGGYGIYGAIPKDWRSLNAMPQALRRTAALGARLLAGPAESLAGLAGKFTARRSHPGHRLGRAAEHLGAGSLAELVGLHYSRWRGMPELVLGAKSAATLFSGPTPDVRDPALAVMLLDTLGYLPDDLCVKTDRATMAASLEARLPFLDPAIAEFAWSLPPALKIRDGVGKAVLRDLLYRHVPRALVDRPKMGFEVPLRRWLAGKLGDWADDLLSEDRLRHQGWLDAPKVAACWREQRSGAKSRRNEIWHALMLQAWIDRAG